MRTLTADNVLQHNTHDGVMESSDSKKSVIIERPVKDEAIFLFQEIAVDGKVYNVFYDLGCGDFCVRKGVLSKLGKRATLLRTGSFFLVGAGNVVTEIKHGVYQVQLPLANGNDALFAGLCMEEVTAKFSRYNVRPLYDDVRTDFIRQGGDIDKFPILSSSGFCGGETDIMLGIKYNRYQPKAIHELESGLTVYRSAFKGADGSTAVIGGPHPLISQIEQQCAQQNIVAKSGFMRSYFSKQLNMYLDGYDICPDSKLKPIEHDMEFEQYSSKSKFSMCEEAGTVANYRCPTCRECKNCKCGPLLEEVSRKAEYGQQVIEDSVVFNEEKKCVECVLPLLEDPAQKLCNNKANALKVYRRWIWKVNQNPVDLESIIRSERKLQARG